MSLKAFLKQNAIQVKNQKHVISPRFIGEDGKPVEWELRALTEEENGKIKDNCTTRTIFKGRQSLNFNSGQYTKSLCAATVAYPDLKDAELQKSYGVTGEDDLLTAMLLPGEYAELLQLVQAVNGYDAEQFEQEKQQAKNS